MKFLLTISRFICLLGFIASLVMYLSSGLGALDVNYKAIYEIIQKCFMMI